MSRELNEVQLLKEIDERQDELLQELDDLNNRVKTLLKQWTHKEEEETAEDEPIEKAA